MLTVQYQERSHKSTNDFNANYNVVSSTHQHRSLKALLDSSHSFIHFATQAYDSFMHVTDISQTSTMCWTLFQGVGRTEALAKHTGGLRSLNCLSRTVLLVLTPVSENSETSFHQSNSVIHWFQGVQNLPFQRWVFSSLHIFKCLNGFKIKIYYSPPSPQGKTVREMLFRFLIYLR